MKHTLGISVQGETVEEIIEKALAEARAFFGQEAELITGSITSTPSAQGGYWGHLNVYAKMPDTVRPWWKPVQGRWSRLLHPSTW